MPLKGGGGVGGHSFKSHGNYIVDHGKSWKKHGIMFLNYCGNPEQTSGLDKDLDQWVFHPLLFNLMSILLHI